MTSRRPLLVLVTLAAVFASALLARPAAAEQKPEKVFGGKILVSDKVYPTPAKTTAAFIAAIRKQTKTQFWEDKQKKTWRLFYAAFFRRPLNDIEVVVKLYDTDAPGRPMVASFEQYVDQRGQTALLSSFTLEHKL